MPHLAVFQRGRLAATSLFAVIERTSAQAAGSPPLTITFTSSPPGVGVEAGTGDKASSQVVHVMADATLAAGGARCRGDLELAGVGFAYPARPERPVFRSLSLVFPAGRVACLMGSALPQAAHIAPVPDCPSLVPSRLQAAPPRWWARAAAASRPSSSCCCASTTPPPARCCWMAAMHALCRSPGCARRCAMPHLCVIVSLQCVPTQLPLGVLRCRSSAWSARRPPCLPAPSLTTSRSTAAPRPSRWRPPPSPPTRMALCPSCPTGGCGLGRRVRAAYALCPAANAACAAAGHLACAAGTTPRWARRAPSSAAASGSASPSRAPCCATRR